MMAEGDLATTMDQSNKIREMQDKIANLRAQVSMAMDFGSLVSSLLTALIMKITLFLFSLPYSLTTFNCQRQCAPLLWSTNYSCPNEH